MKERRPLRMDRSEYFPTDNEWLAAHPDRTIRIRYPQHSEILAEDARNGNSRYADDNDLVYLAVVKLPLGYAYRFFLSAEDYVNADCSEDWALQFLSHLDRERDSDLGITPDLRALLNSGHTCFWRESNDEERAAVERKNGGRWPFPLWTCVFLQAGQVVRKTASFAEDPRQLNDADSLKLLSRLERGSARVQ